jgi:hypothetical protein
MKNEIIRISQITTANINKIKAVGYPCIVLITSTPKTPEAATSVRNPGFFSKDLRSFFTSE